MTLFYRRFDRDCKRSPDEPLPGCGIARMCGVLRSHAAVEEVSAFRSTDFLRDRLLQARQASFRHANNDVIRQIGTAHSFARALLPAGEAFFLHAGAHVLSLGLRAARRGYRRAAGSKLADPECLGYRRGRRRRRRGSWMIRGDLVREGVECPIRIDQTKSELAVAPLRTQVLGGREQNFLERRETDVRLARDDEGGNPADMGGGDRSAGGELITRVRSRLKNADPWGGECDVRSLIGLRQQPVIGVDRRHRDHILVRGGIERLRARSRIASGGDQHDAFVVRLLESELEHRVVGPGKAHIDDAGTFFDRPIDAGENVLRRGLRRILLVRAERMDGEDARARRDAEKPLMRDDGTGHPGAVIVGLVRFAHGIELLAERASEIGMCGIDLRIDDGDRHIFSDAPAMHVTQP